MKKQDAAQVIALTLADLAGIETPNVVAWGQAKELSDKFEAAGYIEIEEEKQGHHYVPSGAGFCAVCDDLPGQGAHAPQEKPLTEVHTEVELAEAQAALDTEPANAVEAHQKEIIRRLKETLAGVRAVADDLRTRGDAIEEKDNNGSIHSLHHAGRGNGYQEAARNIYKALGGE